MRSRALVRDYAGVLDDGPDLVELVRRTYSPPLTVENDVVVIEKPC